MKRLILLVSTWGACLAATSSAATLFFDFGETNQPTAGNYNNVSQTQQPILNAIDSSGTPTGITLNTTGFNPGSNQSGTTTPSGAAAIFNGQATRDNLFGHTQVFVSPPPFPMGVLTFGGLDGSGATKYEFTFFGSRMGVTDNRETKYDASGANFGVAYLNASGNASNVTIVSGIIPTALGEIVVEVSPGPNNNQANGFFYLGALKLDSMAVPEPTGLALASIVALASAWRARR